MTQEIDELFGDAEQQPKPRTALVMALLFVGVLTAVAGLACTAVPGGLMVLGSWALVETEIGRIDSGYLTEEWRRGLTRLKALIWVALALVLGLFVFQCALLSAGFYPQLWGPAIEALEPALRPGPAG